MRKRECWGCKSPDQHTLDKCPTHHCITSKSNMVDKSKVVKREPFKRDAPFKKHRKRVNAVATDNIKPDSPTNETSGEDLCTTFGHLSDEDPIEVQDLDEHMVRRIAMEMKDDYNACTSNPFDTDLDFRYDDEYNCNDATMINAIDGYEFCYQCGSPNHTHRACPDLDAVHFINDESKKGFECLQPPF